MSNIHSSEVRLKSFLILRGNIKTIYYDCRTQSDLATVTPVVTHMLTFVESVSPSTLHLPQLQQRLFECVQENVRRPSPLVTVIQAVTSTLMYVENVFPSTFHLHQQPPPPLREHVQVSVPVPWPLATVTSVVTNTMMFVESVHLLLLLLMPTFHLLEQREQPLTSEQVLTEASLEVRTALLCRQDHSLLENSKTTAEINLPLETPDLLVDVTRDSSCRLLLQQNKLPK